MPTFEFARSPAIRLVPAPPRLWSRRPMLHALVLGLALMTLAAGPAFAQPGSLKKTVAVDVFGGSELTAGTVSADGLTAMLTDILINDGRFVVVERQALASIQTEQQLGSSGGARVETAAASGGLTGANLVIKGAITKYNPNAGGGGLSIGGAPAGMFSAGAGLRTRKTTVSISLRLIDTTTGQVIATVNADGSASGQQADAGLINKTDGSTLGANTFRETAIGKAVQDAILKAVNQIVLNAGGVPWSGLVVENRGGQVYVNAGADQNVQAGMTFGIYRKGEALIDPGTGQVLDLAMERLGSIRIGTVREKFSIGQVVEGQEPSRGDLLKVE